MKHEDGDTCPLCDFKLKQAHAVLQEWFPIIKREFKDCHISWAWRGEADQNAFLKKGDSGVPWPKSKHNKMDTQGRACSEALDLFRLVPPQKALFQYQFYRDISNYSEKAGWADRIQWGLTDPNGKHYDQDHFQIRVNSGAVNKG